MQDIHEDSSKELIYGAYVQNVRHADFAGAEIGDTAVEGKMHF